MATTMEMKGAQAEGQLESRCSPGVRLTRSLLGYGLVAGPFYVGVVLAQALLRPGFDLARDDASLLSNGGWGWVQIANFLLTGLMVIACAVGMRRAMAVGSGGRLAPALLAAFGLGLIGAGVFVADPMNGFPPGASAGRPTSLSSHGLLHIASAGLGFGAFVALCFVMGRRLRSLGQSRLGVASIAVGLLFLAAFFGLASGSDSPAVVLFFWFALLAAWAWLAATAVHLYRRADTVMREDVR